MWSEDRKIKGIWLCPIFFRKWSCHCTSRDGREGTPMSQLHVHSWVHLHFIHSFCLCILIVIARCVSIVIHSNLNLCITFSCWTEEIFVYIMPTVDDIIWCYSEHPVITGKHLIHYSICWNYLASFNMFSHSLNNICLSLVSIPVSLVEFLLFCPFWAVFWAVYLVPDSRTSVSWIFQQLVELFLTDYR